MAEALTIDATPVPVLVATFRIDPIRSGSERYTERNVLRSVVTGDTKFRWTGESFFETWAEALALFTLFATPGDHEATGELLGDETYTVETRPGQITPVDHRPFGVDPTAMWRLAWTLLQT